MPRTIVHEPEPEPEPEGAIEEVETQPEEHKMRR
jgi:hypothetical protein